MRFYKEIEVSEIMYPLDALEWMVFGTAPEEFYSDDGKPVRGCTRCEANEYGFEPSIISEQAFQLCGTTNTYQAYLTATFEGDANNIDELCNGDDYLKKYGQATARYRFIGPPDIREIERVLLLDQVEAFFEPYLTKAKVALLNAILCDEIPTYGLEIPSDVVNYDGSHDREDAIQIPSKNWRISSATWLGDPKPEFVDGFWFVWMKSFDVMKRFPEPLLPSSEVSGTLTGENLTIGFDNPSISHRGNKRGRPSARVDVRQAVCNHLESQIASNKIDPAAVKKEALYFELEQWCLEIFKQKVGRSSIQRWIAPIINAQK